VGNKSAHQCYDNNKSRRDIADKRRQSNRKYTVDESNSNTKKQSDAGQHKDKIMRPEIETRRKGYNACKSQSQNEKTRLSAMCLEEERNQPNTGYNPYKDCVLPERMK
jgi:hypothetical protein